MHHDGSADVRLLLRHLNPGALKALWQRTFNVGGPHHSMLVRDEGALYWIAEHIQRLSGEEAVPLSQFAASGLYRIVAFHPFMDCNHRTGTLFCLEVMRQGGYVLSVPTTEAIQFIKSIDMQGLAEEEVLQWVNKSFRRST